MVLKLVPYCICFIHLPLLVQVFLDIGYEVTHPLCDRVLILARLDVVSEIAELAGTKKDVLTTLGRSPDIQRGITRVFHRTATAAEFITVIRAVLFAGKQLKQLQVEDDDCVGKAKEKIIGSPLLRRLILTQY
ncbi:hypothetical protein MKW94_030901 [Papaver nudicaule]|uniref:DNA mismatch repair protein MutS core domain-containing protein n=1 Tax=Papaver nudicaule TaxID=74823 RepID=A0AA41V6F6_PAPNU|nr:hypothetical protein [Papaver nudicaule]